jgi:starch-binding outer membrane protein, SusD/RagB family
VLAFDSENTYGGGGIYKERHPLGYFTNNRPEEGGLYYMKPSESFVNMFKTNQDVYRGEGYSYYIDNNKQLQTKDTLIWKYCGIDPNGTRREPFVTYGNINIIRTSDLYLKAAEAANRLGYAITARDILNQNRGRVAVPPAKLQADATIEEIEDGIMEERALELGFEGIRWYDLVRIAKRRNDPNYLIDKILVNVPEADREKVRARLELQSKNNWHLPYSAKAFQLNNNLKN